MSEQSAVDQYLIDHLGEAGWTRTFYSTLLGTGDLEHNNDRVRIRVTHAAKDHETLLELQPAGRARIHLLFHPMDSPERLVQVLTDWQDHISEADLITFMREIQVAYPNIMGDRSGEGDWAPLRLDD